MRILDPKLVLGPRFVSLRYGKDKKGHFWLFSANYGPIFHRIWGFRNRNLYKACGDTMWGILCFTKSLCCDMPPGFFFFLRKPLWNMSLRDGNKNFWWPCQNEKWSNNSRNKHFWEHLLTHYVTAQVHRYRYTHACRKNRNRYRNRTYDYYVVT